METYKAHQLTNRESEILQWQEEIRASQNVKYFIDNYLNIELHWYQKLALKFLTRKTRRSALFVTRV